MFRETRLSQALVGIDYDFILIDCRPTLGILSFNVLYASGIVLIPCETARFSLEGFADLLNTVKVLKGRDESEQLLQRLATDYHHTHEDLSRAVGKPVHDGSGVEFFSMFRW